VNWETIYRNGLNFYALRHTFETIGGETTDQVAVDHIMGHVDPSMGARYRERVSDARLKAVTDFVRNWLYNDDQPANDEDQQEEETAAIIPMKAARAYRSR